MNKDRRKKETKFPSSTSYTGRFAGTTTLSLAASETQAHRHRHRHAHPSGTSVRVSVQSTCSRVYEFCLLTDLVREQARIGLFLVFCNQRDYSLSSPETPQASAFFSPSTDLTEHKGHAKTKVRFLFSLRPLRSFHRFASSKNPHRHRHPPETPPAKKSDKRKEPRTRRKREQRA